MSLDLLLSLVLAAAFHAALILLIPIVPLAAGCRLINAVQRARLPITPMIETASLLVGTMIGALLLTVYMPPGSLGIASLFAVDGFWDISLGQFLLDRVNPANYPLHEVLLPDLSGLAEKLGTIGYATLPAVLAVVAVPLITDRSPAGIANAVRNLLIVVWAAYGTIYLVCLLYWLVALLNFWAFLAALLVIQSIRR